MAISGYIACAELLALDPDLVRRLLADHSADAHGRCRTHHSRREAHPCSIRSLAELAAGFTRAARPKPEERSGDAARVDGPDRPVRPRVPRPTRLRAFGGVATTARRRSVG